MKLLDKYENSEKFGEDNISYTFRIIYRHLEKTLTNSEVNALHSQIEDITTKEFGGMLRIS